MVAALSGYTAASTARQRAPAGSARRARSTLARAPSAPAASRARGTLFLFLGAPLRARHVVPRRPRAYAIPARASRRTCRALRPAPTASAHTSPPPAPRGGGVSRGGGGGGGVPPFPPRDPFAGLDFARLSVVFRASLSPAILSDRARAASRRVRGRAHLPDSARIAPMPRARPPELARPPRPAACRRAGPAAPAARRAPAPGGTGGRREDGDTDAEGDGSASHQRAPARSLVAGSMRGTSRWMTASAVTYASPQATKTSE